MEKFRVEGSLTATFVRGGISKEKKKPYLQVSDGIAPIFISIPKDMEIDEDTFTRYERGDEIEMTVTVDPFSNRTTLVGL